MHLAHLFVVQKDLEVSLELCPGFFLAKALGFRDLLEEMVLQTTDDLRSLVVNRDPARPCGLDAE